jgi:predicted DNA-binding ribbon-helix-helix protein
LIHVQGHGLDGTTNRTGKCNSSSDGRLLMSRLRDGNQPGRDKMKTTVFKRSVVIAGRKTSISLEAEFWDGIRQIASREGVTTSALLSRIQGGRHDGNFSSAVRLFVLEDLQKAIDPTLRYGPDQSQRSHRRTRP